MWPGNETVNVLVTSIFDWINWDRLITLGVFKWFYLYQTIRRSWCFYIIIAMNENLNKNLVTHSKNIFPANHAKRHTQISLFWFIILLHGQFICWTHTQMMKCVKHCIVWKRLMAMGVNIGVLNSLNHLQCVDDVERSEIFS